MATRSEIDFNELADIVSDAAKLAEIPVAAEAGSGLLKHHGVMVCVYAAALWRLRTPISPIWPVRALSQIAVSDLRTIDLGKYTDEVYAFRKWVVALLSPHTTLEDWLDARGICCDWGKKADRAKLVRTRVEWMKWMAKTLKRRSRERKAGEARNRIRSKNTRRSGEDA